MTFPMSLVDPIMVSMRKHVPDNNVVGRRLGMSEGTDTIGVFPASWRPEKESMLMGRAFEEQLSAEPTLNYYAVRVQNLRIDADEEAGRTAFGVTSKKIRAILYRDPALHVSLQSLSEEMFGVVERMKRFEIVKQDFLDAMTNMGAYFMCTTEIVFETETTPAQ